jgi:hypothetical protein
VTATNSQTVRCGLCYQPFSPKGFRIHFGMKHKKEHQHHAAQALVYVRCPACMASLSPAEKEAVAVYLHDRLGGPNLVWIAREVLATMADAR